MKTRQMPFTRVVLAVLVGIVGLAGGGTPALANTVTIPISGTIVGMPESVQLSGSAEIASTLVPIGELGEPPKVILHIKLVGVTGPGESGKTYVAPGENVLIRLLGSSDFLELFFPFHPNGSDGHLKGRTARVTFSFSFDTATGDITAVTTDGLTTP